MGPWWLQSTQRGTNQRLGITLSRSGNFVSSSSSSFFFYPLLPFSVTELAMAMRPDLHIEYAALAPCLLKPLPVFLRWLPNDTQIRHWSLDFSMRCSINRSPRKSCSRSASARDEKKTVACESFCHLIANQDSACWTACSKHLRGWLRLSTSNWLDSFQRILTYFLTLFSTSSQLPHVVIRAFSKQCLMRMVCQTLYARDVYTPIAAYTLSP